MTDERFRRAFGEQFFDRFWQLKPDWAMQIGYYKYADRLAVPDAAAREETLAQLDEWLAELRAIEVAGLSPDVRADRAMLENELLADRWSLTELRAWQWNPSLYNVAELDPHRHIQQTQQELAEKAGPLLATRLEIEAYARSISGGVLLDFDWAPFVAGTGGDAGIGGTATWGASRTRSWCAPP